MHLSHLIVKPFENAKYEECDNEANKSRTFLRNT